MLSVFTPSHDPRWLPDLYDSLLAQDHENWEWIILLNNGAKWACEDHRVFIHHHRGEETAVGFLKRLAVERTHSDILVEVDHDDIVAPHALRTITETFAANPHAGFVYSDASQINEDGSPNYELFDLTHGWSYYEQGEYLIAHSMAPLPHNISYIWYAPNHVRAFTREAYDKAGGYDASREIADDHDLMCRLYQVTDFVRIPEPLYFQRLHPTNTQKVRNADIQVETQALYEQHVQANALAWADRSGLQCLDFGAAHNKPDGYLGVDLHDADLVGDVLDVLSKLPDDSCGVIRAVDFLEHVTDKVRLMNEIHRVLAHGGMLLSLTPSTDGRGAFQDPTHIAFWNENSFWYYTDPNYASFVTDITCRFQVSKINTFFPSDWHAEHQISYVQANLIALKDGERCGGRMSWP